MNQPKAAPLGVGLVTHTLATSYFEDLVTGAAEVLRACAVRPVCFTMGVPSNASPDANHPFFELVSSEALSGVVMASSAARSDQIDRFVARVSGLPRACVGQWVKGIPSVWVQNAAGIRALVRHLVDECGHQRIAFVRGPPHNAEAEARFRAYEDTLASRTIRRSSALIQPGNFTFQAGVEAAERLLALADFERPTAIMAANDLTATGVLHALKAHGFRVPEDMAVVGFDDLEARTTTPPLTTARQPIYEMGMRAARLVLAQMRGERVLDENMFEPRVIVRASCGARGVPRMPPADPAARPVFLASVDRHDHWLWSLAHREANAKGQSGGLGPLLDLMQIDFNRERDAAVVLRELVIAGRQEALRAIRALVESATAEELIRGLAWFLPQLQIDTCFVSRLTKPNDAAGKARLFAAFQQGQVSFRPEAPAYPARQLLPADVSLPGEDRLWLVHPLIRDGSMLGFALICGRLYDPAAVAELCHILALAL